MKKEKTLYQVCSFCFMTLSVEIYVQSRQESGCSIELDLFRVVSKDINDIKCCRLQTIYVYCFVYAVHQTFAQL